ncbi:hypothetical protein KP509_07G100000 [Ceratopteris richardii]|uniref:Peptidase A2 domain-containing protein n=1 Tax=Ceratopteris richardii TaxID=49495 RepID=A0A8T2UL54_CERRI|nr:hypothetical protein KP509_07G100000 [Ceratopteris richardii]
MKLRGQGRDQSRSNAHEAPRYYMAMCEASGICSHRIVDRCPFMTLEVGQGNSARTVKALIDLGAATSAVKLFYFQELQLSVNPIEAYLIGLRGAKTPWMGEVEIPIYIQDVLMTVKVLVSSEDLTKPLVLGQDWIYDHAVNLNLRSGLLQVWVDQTRVTIELQDRALRELRKAPNLGPSRSTHVDKDVFLVQNFVMQLRRRS